MVVLVLLKSRDEIKESIGVDNNIFNDEIKTDNDVSHRNVSDDSDPDFETEEGRRRLKKEMKWEAAFSGMNHRRLILI